MIPETVDDLLKRADVFRPFDRDCQCMGLIASLATQVRRYQQALAAERLKRKAAEERGDRQGERLAAEREQRDAALAAERDDRERERLVAEDIQHGLEVDLAAERERADDATVRLKSMLSELWDGVRIHGLKAPKRGRDGERLIHAYCGGIVEAMEQRAAAIERAERAEATLAELQRWPTLDWAEASRRFVQELASLARGGEQPAAKRALDAMDGLKCYVNRLEARAEAAEAELVAINKAADCPPGTRLEDALRTAEAEVNRMKGVCDGYLDAEVEAEARAEAAETAIAQADENVRDLTQRIHELEGEVERLRGEVRKWRADAERLAADGATIAAAYLRGGGIE